MPTPETPSATVGARLAPRFGLFMSQLGEIAGEVRRLTAEFGA
jgi:hypothetical protein